MSVRVGGFLFIDTETDPGWSWNKVRKGAVGGHSLLFEVEERSEDGSNTLICDDISEVPQVAAQVIR